MLDKRELDRRQRADRRRPLDDYIRGILSFKSLPDPRGQLQRELDNAFVNGASECWYHNHPLSRRQLGVSLASKGAAL
jgi:hypothetical protein